MNKRFTRLFLIILLGFWSGITNLISQNCDVPTNVNTNNVLIFPL